MKITMTIIIMMIFLTIMITNNDSNRKGKTLKVATKKAFKIKEYFRLISET